MDPDLVVIHSGINDVRNARFPDLQEAPDPRTLIWAGQLAKLHRGPMQGPGLWLWLKHVSYLARVPGYALEVLRQRQELHVIQEVKPYDAALGYFQLNVERTIALGLGAGAAVILSVPPSALSMRNQPTDPVERSYWIKDAGTTEAYRQRIADRMATLAAEASARGDRVSYVTHNLSIGQFLDDAHLTGDGNREVAAQLVEAARPYLAETGEVHRDLELSCR
jgi:hypothetical protein